MILNCLIGFSRDGKLSGSNCNLYLLLDESFPLIYPVYDSTYVLSSLKLKTQK